MGLALKIASLGLGAVTALLLILLDYVESWKDSSKRRHRVARWVAKLSIIASLACGVGSAVVDDQANDAMSSKLDEANARAAHMEAVIDKIAAALHVSPNVVRVGGDQLLREIEELKRRADHIEGEIAPRTLRPEQSSVLIANLRGSPSSIDIVASMGDGEGQSFAEALAMNFRIAGWKAEVSQAAFSGPRQGLIVVVRDGNKPPPSANVVINALTKAGLSVSGQQDPALQEGAVSLVVGFRPQTK